MKDVTELNNNTIIGAHKDSEHTHTLSSYFEGQKVYLSLFSLLASYSNLQLLFNLLLIGYRAHTKRTIETIRKDVG